MLWEFRFRRIGRSGYACCLLVFLIWRDVVPLARSLGGDGHELGTHPSGLALVADVDQRHRRAAEQACRPRAIYCPLTGSAFRSSDFEANAFPVWHRDDVALL